MTLQNHSKLHVVAAVIYSIHCIFQFIFYLSNSIFFLYFQYPFHLVSISIHSLRFPASTVLYFCHSLFRLNQNSLLDVMNARVRIWITISTWIDKDRLLYTQALTQEFTHIHTFTQARMGPSTWTVKLYFVYWSFFIFLDDHIILLMAFGMPVKWLFREQK